MKKRSSLCSAGSLKSFLQQTRVYRHTHKGTQALPLSLSFCFCSASLFLPPLSSPPYPFIFAPQFAPGSPRPPPVPQYLPLVCCPGFDMCSAKKINSTHFGSIFFPSYHGFNNSNKAGAFSTALTHIYLLFIATIISPKR